MMAHVESHLRGHIRYYGVSGNTRSLRKYFFRASYGNGSTDAVNATLLLGQVSGRLYPAGCPILALFTIFIPSRSG
jgi:hypothetical protein